MRLVDDWREFYKWFSTWLIGLAAAAPMLYLSLPTIQDKISPTLFGWIQTALVLLIFFGRIVKQKPDADQTSPPKP